MRGPAGVRFCDTLVEIPRDATLQIVGRPPRPIFLEALALFRSDVTVAQDGSQGDHTAVPICFESNWQAAVAHAGLEDDGRELLIMSDIGSSYFDWLHLPFGQISVTADEAEISHREFADYVLGHGSFFGTREGAEIIHEPVRYGQFDRSDDPEKQEKLDRVLDGLADDASRDDLNHVLKAAPVDMWRHWLKRVMSGMEYFDYIQLQPEDVVLNCGVHGGAEIPQFLARLGKRGRLFNVDPLGHRYLQPFVVDAIEQADCQVTEVAAALNYRDGEIVLPVEEGGMAASYSINRSDFEVRSGFQAFPCIRIDDIFDNYDLDRFDYLKMDIEGAEIAALRGGMQAIKRFRPTLAISIYHAPEHFWDIPCSLMRELEDYCFFVRHYHFISNETLLYAIPKERPMVPRRPEMPIFLRD